MKLPQIRKQTLQPRDARICNPTVTNFTEEQNENDASHVLAEIYSQAKLFTEPINDRNFLDNDH
jgi:hypothetical protein